MIDNIITKNINEEYMMIKQIKRSKQAEVFLAVLYKQTDKVVIKSCINDKKKKAFINEINNIKKLNENGGHANIIKFHEAFKNINDELYLVTPYYHGRDLNEVCICYSNTYGKDNSFYLNIIQSLILNLLDGLKFIHDNNIVHRDIKPENIIVNETNNLDNTLVGTSFIQSMLCPIIIDFGFSVEINKKDNRINGTPNYLSPEILYGYIHAKDVIFSKENDLWALGISFYGIIKGKMWKKQISTLLELAQHITSKKQTLNISTSNINVNKIINMLTDYQPDIRSNVYNITVN